MTQQLQRKPRQAQKRASGMTRQDAGRLGGLKTAQTHGSEFYRQIGREGGKARGEG